RDWSSDVCSSDLMSLEKSSFWFLDQIEETRPLFEMVRNAEEHFILEQYSACLNGLRTFAEKLLNYHYRNEEHERLAPLIKKLKVDDKVHYEIMSYFYTIKNWGNIGSHENVKQNDEYKIFTSYVLLSVYKISKWLIDENYSQRLDDFDLEGYEDETYQLPSNQQEIKTSESSQSKQSVDDQSHHETEADKYEKIIKESRKLQEQNLIILQKIKNMEEIDELSHQLHIEDQYHENEYHQLRMDKLNFIIKTLFKEFGMVVPIDHLENLTSSDPQYKLSEREKRWYMANDWKMKNPESNELVDTEEKRNDFNTPSLFGDDTDKITRDDQTEKCEIDTDEETEDKKPETRSEDKPKNNVHTIESINKNINIKF